MKEKIFYSSLAIGLALTLAVGVINFSVQCEDIRSKVLRFHILANSDTDYDQQLKLKVRDRVLKESESLFCDCKSKQDAINKTQENLDLLENIAKRELMKNGCYDEVSVSVKESFFETRTYETVTLPSGVYQALTVEIGEAKGHNWWCVMFPQLCVPSVSRRDDIEDTLSGGQTDIVTSPKKYKVGFYFVELFEKLKYNLS